MQNLTFDFPLENGRAPRPGFRLRRLEMLNWGTFDSKVAVLEPDLGWTLLVGQNGSGKSTAVDALRTLLVPPGSLKYNDASGDQRRRDRSRKSYVRGTWAVLSDDESGLPVAKDLRKPGVLSVLLGVFANESDGRTVTLVQILWEANDDTQQRFAVARSEKSIAQHLADLGSSGNLKKTLMSRGFDHVSESFPAYAAYFCKQLAIPSLAALDVFNQAIGLKDVPDVNSFIRRHMLEESDVLAHLRENVQPHFRELDECWAIIQKAVKQLEALEPIVRAHDRMAEATQRRAELETLSAALPWHFDSHRLELRHAEAGELERRIGLLEQRKAEVEQECARDQQEYDAKQRELGANSTQLILERIRSQIGATTERLKATQATRKRFSEALESLGGKAIPESEAEFATFCMELEHEESELQNQLTRGEEERLQLGVDLRDVQQQLKSIEGELDNLQKNRGLIDKTYIDLRYLLCAEVGLEPADLPYAGELIQVQPEHAAWTGAIERLLHSFGISLLIPERHYRPAAAFINARHLGLRLNFYRVPQQVLPVRPDLLGDQSRVPARLTFKTDHPLAAWVKGEVVRRFSHVCCADTVELEKVDRGLTVRGLIRDGQYRHVKDDQYDVEDAKSHVLGWTSAAKLQALKASVARLQSQEHQIQGKIKSAKEILDFLRKRSRAAHDLKQFVSFSEIDTDSIQRELARLIREREEIEAADNQLKVLTSQIALLNTRMISGRTTIQNLVVELRAAQGALAQSCSERERLAKLLEEWTERENDVPHGQIASLVEFDKLTLANIDAVEKQASDRLGKQINYTTGEINQAAQEMISPMTTFLHEYNEFSTELKPQKEYALEFVALRCRIEQEELPRHREHFEKYLTETLIRNMLLFRSKIDDHQRSIQSRLRMINAALARIPYSDSTYVQIVSQKTRHGEIQQFDAELKGCVDFGLDPTEDERMLIVERIRVLLGKLSKDELWTRRVTDARNWLEFGIKELSSSDHAQVHFFSASTGKSGGQKAKLAFTILASAISAQYGLFQASSPQETFRLVVIDEAFARTDETNSEQALVLFQRLNLQLVVVNPFDAKGRIVEDFADSFHLVVNPTGKNSKIQRISRAEYREVRQDETVPMTAASVTPPDSEAEEGVLAEPV